MIDLGEMPVGDYGKSYIHSVLDRTPGLSADLRATINQQGNFYALLPSNTALTRARMFEAGGVATIKGSTEWLADRISNHSAHGRSGVVMVQDLSAKPSDYLRHPPAVDIWVHEEQTYLWEEFGGIKLPQVEQLRRSVKSFMFVGFLVSSACIAEAIRTNRASLSGIAADVIEMYVSAYDRESFVMWVR